jgi:hypothetical protein
MSHTSYRTQTGYLATLCQEWDQDFAERIHDFGPLGIIECGRLVDTVHAAPKGGSDRQLHALLTLAAAGDSVSTRLLLQVMLPKTVQLARTCACLRTLSPEDAAWSAFSAMWEAVKTYPLHRTTSVAGNLGLNALALINETLGLPRNHVDEVGVSDEDLEAKMNEGADAQSTEPGWGDSSFHDLVKVLTWAADTGTLTRREIGILARADLGEETDREALAEELGSTRASLSKRVWRIRTKLMEAVQEYVLVNGRW